MFEKLLFTILVITLCHGTILVIILCHGQRDKQFRFDYKFSKGADGWLKLHHLPAVWQEARLRCHAEGAVLASPLTSQLRTAILDHVYQEKNIITIFTGIHSVFSKGDYHSIEGEANACSNATLYTKERDRQEPGGVPLLKIPVIWAPGQPDNQNNKESCLAMLTADHTGSLNDVDCSVPYPYVCYKKYENLVINECGTHDTEYKMDARTKSCYKFHRSGLPWSRAFMTCAGEGAHLAIINDDLESRVLGELFAKYPDRLITSKHPGIAAVGFHDWGEHGSWMTIHGETLHQAGFSRFENNQPDNATMERNGDRGEFCGSIFRSGNLNDVWCNVPIPFICEKKPSSLFPDLDD